MGASQANGKSCRRVSCLSCFRWGSQIGLTYHELASDHIRNLEASNKIGREAQIQLQHANHELEMLRRENETLRNENHHLYQEMQHYREQARPNTATTMHPQPPMYAAPPPAPMGDPSRSLPPLSNGIPAANSMQGVQYSDERR